MTRLAPSAPPLPPLPASYLGDMTRDHIDQNLRCGADRLALLLSLIDERLSFSVQALRLFDNRLSPISLRARMTRPAFVSRWTLKGAGSGSGCVVIMFRANTGQMAQRLLRRCRKRRQCVDVARSVLNDDGRLVIRRDLFSAHRSMRQRKSSPSSQIQATQLVRDLWCRSPGAVDHRCA